MRVLISRKPQTVDGLKQFIEVMMTKCKINESAIRFTIHELSHTIFALQEGYKVTKIDLYSEVEVEYGEDQIILDRTVSTIEKSDLDKVDLSKYKKVITSYLLILLTGNVSEDIFFDKNTDYSKSVKELAQFTNERYFLSQSDGIKFFNTLRNAQLILKNDDSEYYINIVKKRMRNQNYVSLLWKLLIQIYFYNFSFFKYPKTNFSLVKVNSLIDIIKKSPI